MKSEVVWFNRKTEDLNKKFIAICQARRQGQSTEGVLQKEI